MDDQKRMRQIEEKLSIADSKFTGLINSVHFLKEFVEKDYKCDMREFKEFRQKWKQLQDQMNRTLKEYNQYGEAMGSFKAQIKIVKKRARSMKRDEGLEELKQKKQTNHKKNSEAREKMKEMINSKS